MLTISKDMELDGQVVDFMPRDTKIFKVMIKRKNKIEMNEFIKYVIENRNLYKEDEEKLMRFYNLLS